MSLTGCPWSRIMWTTWAYCPGPWWPATTTAAMKAGTRTSPVPRDTTKRGPLLDLAPGTIAPATVLAPVPAITVPVTVPVLVQVTTVPVLAPTARARAIIAPVTVPAPAPASMTDAARAMMVPAPARVPAARGPIIGLTVPVPARALSFSG